MAYTTTEQVQSAAGGEDRLLQICSDSAGDLDTVRLALAQLHADMLIDGHAGIRFADLLNSGGSAVNTAIAYAAAETVYQLKCQLGQNTTNDDNLADARLAIYQEIRDGKFLPKAADDTPLTPTASDGSQFIERDDADAHPWSREGMKF